MVATYTPSGWMMAIIVGAVLAILSIVVIAYPFLKSRSLGRGPAPVPVEDDEEGPDLESIYDAIRTLQLEHQLGKVPRGLYQEQLNAYRLQAARALKRQMEAQARDADWALEQEVLVARAGLAQPNGHAASCPNCGAAVGYELAQCPECNVDLAPGTPDSREAAQG